MFKNIFFKLQAIIMLSLGYLALSLLLGATHVSALSGGDWHAGRIIDDSVFYNANTMSIDQIQQFLNAKVPNCDSNGTQLYAGTTRAAYSQSHGVTLPIICLKDYKENTSTHANNLNGAPVPDGAKSAANIIWDASQQYGINPQVLLVLLQKEQSLITDDWPWPIQYKSATGYGCPDTAACDSQYYGFYNQVTSAARQFRLYANNPHKYNFWPGPGNSIQYSPNGACGSSQVSIENQATASLYDYTPYQPNQAALNNIYGTGDSCSAFGNLNFWKLFSDWFGTTYGSLGDRFLLAKSDDPNDLRQWLIYSGIKQYIPDAQTLYAWGLQNAPLLTLSSFTMNSYAVGPNLDRLMRLNGGNAIYFLDNGRRFHVQSQAEMDAWNLGGIVISNVTNGIFNSLGDGGDLPYAVHDPNSQAIYAVDGNNGSGQTVLRQYYNGPTLFAWEGDNTPFITVSNDYWSKIKNAIGPVINTTKISYGGSEYQVISGQKLLESSAVAPLYPGTAIAVSSATFNRLVPSANMTHLLKSYSAPDVYLIDNGVKHHIVSPAVLQAWQANGTNVLIVNDNFLNSIPAGNPTGAFMADTGGQLYVLDGNKTAVPSNLSAAYRASGEILSASPSLINLLPTSAQQATGFVKGTNTPSVYVVDNGGKLRHIPNPEGGIAWGAFTTGITTLADSTVSNGFSQAADASQYVSDGSGEYIMENGQKLPVSQSNKANWGLSNPQVYSDGTLGRLPQSSTGVDDNFKTDNGFYAMTKQGSQYITTDPDIAAAWNLQNAPVHNRSMLKLSPNVMLTRYVRSNAPGDNRNFLVDNSHWYNLSDSEANNFNLPNQPMMSFDPSQAQGGITDLANPIIKNNQGNYVVIDNGGKRIFPSQVVQDYWTNHSQMPSPTMSDGLMNSLPTKGLIERTIKDQDPAVYAVPNGTKNHVVSPEVFTRSYAPFAQVSDKLINALPEGTPINQ